jgi:hypothetical protein
MGRIFRKVTVHSLGAQTQNIEFFIKLGFTGEILVYFIVVQYSKINTGLLWNNLLHFQVKVSCNMRNNVQYLRTSFFI